MKFNIKKTIIANNRGIALPISMFVLMGVLVASATLIRSGELSLNVAANIGQRALVTNSNDAAVEAANNWLVSNLNNLENDNRAAGYFSAYPVGVPDYTTDAPWLNAKVLAQDPNGNTSRYLIYRMCTQPNTAFNGSNSGVPNTCATKTTTDSSTLGNSSGFGAFNYSSSPQLYYKIIAKTENTRNAMTITETIIAVGS